MLLFNFTDKNRENRLLSDIVYASIIIACASFSQSVAGVGFVMVATPFLLAILDVKDTALITFFLSVICQILIVCRHWRLIHPQMFLISCSEARLARLPDSGFFLLPASPP